MQKGICKPARTKENCGAAQTSDQSCIEEGGSEDAVCVFIALLSHPGGYHLGHRKRQTVGGKKQNNCVYIKRRRVVAVALIADDTGQRQAVQESDHT